MGSSGSKESTHSAPDGSAQLDAMDESTPVASDPAPGQVTAASPNIGAPFDIDIDDPAPRTLQEAVISANPEVEMDETAPIPPQPEAAAAAPPPSGRVGGETLALFWELMDELCECAVHGRGPPHDANRYVAAYKSVYDLATKAPPSPESPHAALYADIRTTLANLCARCVATHTGEGDPTPSRAMTSATAVVRAVLAYLDRHWIPRAMEDGRPGVVTIAELCEQLWDEAVQERRARIDREEPVERRAKQARIEVAGARPPHGAQNAAFGPEPTAEGTLRLGSVDHEGGEVDVCEVSAAVAERVFPVLQRLVEDTGLEPSSPIPTVIPLERVAVCPTHTLQRTVAVGTAIAADLAAAQVATYPTERLFHSHHALLGESPVELRELIAAANFLGGDTLVNVGCFALGSLLTEHYPRQALAFCVDGQLPNELPVDTDDNKAVVVQSEAQAEGASAAAAAAPQTDEGQDLDEDYSPRIPFCTDDGKVILVPLEVVRLMAAVWPFVEHGCIQPLTDFPDLCTAAPRWEVLVAELQWLEDRIPVAYTAVQQAVRNQMGIRVPDISSDALARAVTWGRHNVHTCDPTDEELMDMRMTPISGWDLEFCKMPQSTLFQVINVANFLDMKGLLNLTCKSVAEMIKGKSPTQIQEAFGIKDDFTDEEREQVRREHEWLN